MLQCLFAIGGRKILSLWSFVRYPISTNRNFREVRLPNYSFLINEIFKFLWEINKLADF